MSAPHDTTTPATFRGLLKETAAPRRFGGQVTK